MTVFVEPNVLEEDEIKDDIEFRDIKGKLQIYKKSNFKAVITYLRNIWDVEK